VRTRADWWYNVLQAYTRESGIWGCPSKEYAKYGYGQNYRALCGYGIPGLGYYCLWSYHVPFAQVENACGTVIFNDTSSILNPADPPEKWKEHRAAVTSGYCRFPMDNVHGDGAYVAWVTSPWRPAPRHPSKATNCLFFDGHVDSVVTRDLVDDDYGEPNCLYDNE
jgi:prepilin-type processing-associated H-X9-DG protein